jgi:YfiH family protein
MPFHQLDALRYYTFNLLDAENVQHAVFTRRGGVSLAPWAALNVGSTVGDDVEHVRENRRRAFQALQRPPQSMYDSWLVHRADVIFVEAPRSLDVRPLQADVLLTDRPDVTLFMRFADCVPILLYEPRQGVVGLVHAGWLGTVRAAARSAVEAMTARYGAHPADVIAAIGPSIGPDHYEVGVDVIEHVQQAFEGYAGALLTSRNGGTYFDLWSANRMLLEQAGVRRIEVSGLCTACSLEDWYSHRLEKGRTGRFGALIGLS